MKTRKLPIIFFLLLAGPITASACDIPVFRYALDYWPADSFYATLFHKGQLAEEEKGLLSRLEEYTVDEESLLNLEIEAIDLSAPAKETHPLYEEAGSPQTPALVLTYPGSSMNSGPVSTVPFDSESVSTLLDSPKRRELVSRLQNGQSAVWVFLKSGDQERDAETLETLESSLEKLEGSLELPSVADDPNAPEDLLDPELGDGPPLRIEFSILSLDRNDPEETLLVNLLLHSEPDLLEPDFVSEPMVFPVYGRGRVLYALIGKGINPDVIGEACEFLVGPCSCQVKDLNPGSTDLLLAASWGDPGAGPMEGLQLGVVSAAEGLGSSEESGTILSRHTALIIAIQVLLVIGVSGFLLLRRRETSLG